MTALFLTLARLLIGGGVVLLVLASYAWWGNPQSLLGDLGRWGIAGIAAGLFFFMGHRIVLRLLRHRAAHSGK